MPEQRKNELDKSASEMERRIRERTAELEILGSRLTRVTIGTFYDHIHPEDRELTRKAIEKSIETKTAYDIEYRTIDPQAPKDFKWIRAIGWTAYD